MSAADATPKPLVEDETLVRLLSGIASDPDLELEWIDLLSQLEYVGCRKIVKAVAFESVSLEILRHVSEEASHAFLLKTVVEEGGLRNRSWREGRYAEAGWKYFQRLDQQVSALAAPGELAYPGVSWAIERRVLVVYPAYLKITANEKLRRALQRILAQEERHGAQFGALPFPAATWPTSRGSRRRSGPSSSPTRPAFPRPPSAANPRDKKDRLFCRSRSLGAPSDKIDGRFCLRDGF